MRKVALSIIGFLALAGVIGYLATSGVLSGGGASSESAPTAGATRAQDQAVVGFESEDGETTPGGATEVRAGLSGGGSLSGVGNVPPIGPAVVKSATISIEVRKDGFESAFNAATFIAGTYGGYVESSSTAGTKTQSGELTIRLPSASFDRAMAELRGLGTVEGQTISGQDVTAEFVDLDSRLTTWETQEVVLLRLMRQATSVEATLRVQRELQDVQFRIEQIKGQLRVLENRTSLATIQVSIREPGVARLEKAAAGERPSLGEAWDRALNGFLGVIYAIVVGLGYLVPVTAVALAGWFGYRRLRARPAVS
ncbi:MAG: DUF4349 domain-containing protein [Actinomycetota bacterium]